MQKLEGHDGSVSAVAFSADGQLLASASYDQTVRLWNLATGEQVQKLEAHDDSVSAVAFSADGQLLASASEDRTVRLWNPATGEQVQKLEGHDDSVLAVAFSADGQLLASASEDRTVRLWNPATGEQVQKLEGQAVAFSADGQLLASASNDGTVRLWNLATGEQKGVYDTLPSYVFSLAFSPNGHHLETNVGRIDLHPEHATTTPTNMIDACMISVKDRWITYRGRDLVWLPHEWRRQCSAASNGQVAIGSPSGRLIFASTVRTDSL